jgi:hypothetical protein
MSKDDGIPDLGGRLAIGAIAGFVATMAMTSAMKRLYRHIPDKASARAAPDPVPESPELRLALTFACGAACGALIAAANPRPGRVAGVLAGGGIWFVSQISGIPAFAALPPEKGGTLKSDLAGLGGHLAWGWSVAEAMRELDGVRVLLSKAGEETRPGAMPA